jgi:hypothetical protein
LGSFVNRGTLILNGDVTVSALDFRQEPSGTLVSNTFGGPDSKFGQLIVNTAELAGSLVVGTAGISPPPGTSFTIISGGPVTGQFSSVDVAAPFQAMVGGNDVRLTVPASPPIIPPVVPPFPPVVAAGTPQRFFTVGADEGSGPQVVFIGPDGTPIRQVDAFAPSFTGGVRVAALDFNGDGTPDVVAGPGPGLPALLRFINGATGGIDREFLAYEEAFTGGVFVASADFNGDGVPDLVTSPDVGGGPRIRIFDGKSQTVLADFFGIDDVEFRGGTRIALGDLNGDGKPDLIIGAGFGGGPRVAIFDGSDLNPSRAPRKLVGDFFAFEPGLRNGVFAAAGDVDGDGTTDLIFGAGPGGGPRVLGFSGAAFLASGGSNRVQVANFFAGDVNTRGGVRVTAKDLDGDNRADLIVGAGSGATSVVTTYLGNAIPVDGTPAAANSFTAFPSDFLGGVFVG